MTIPAWLNADGYWLGRLFFERGLAALFLVAFLSARNQFPALLGENGLTPVPRYLAQRRFRQAPSLFHWRYSDRLFSFVAWTGIGLSAAILCGALAYAPAGLPALVWLLLSFLYLSIVNVGQTFYSFGWESMLVEAGFFAAFLGPQPSAPSLIPILLLRWMLFRVELGAGLIKLRAGGLWKDLRALEYHHETQPMPNPLSRFAHRSLPKASLRAGVVFSHCVQILVPFALFLPQPIAGSAAALIILHQLLLIAFGNYAWLNALTVLLAFAALPDAWLAPLTGLSAPTDLPARPLAWELVLIGLLLVTLWLSVKPTLNLFSPRQRMNCCYNNWKLVNSYGAFGGVTTERYEIILEATESEPDDPQAQWRPYEFKGKPGDPARRPPQIAPYHLRLDWQMWFLPLSVHVGPSGIAPRGYPPWFIAFVEKLLQNDAPTLRLLRSHPFPDAPPRSLRARFFRYRFASARSGRVWDREYVDDYLPPVDLKRLRNRF